MYHHLNNSIYYFLCAPTLSQPLLQLTHPASTQS